jgi:hypothetical protein
MKAVRRFKSKGNDSLDLLLDTICNAFGGIVLIAILITLLTQDTQERIEEESASVDRELVERQIAALQSDIKEAQEYLQRQAASISVDPNLLGRLDELKAQLQTAKGKNDEAWTAWKDSASKAAGDNPKADQAFGDKVAITSRLSRLRTENIALNEKLDRLRMRLDTLRRERADVITSRSEQLRLPKEQAARSGHVYILLKQGEIFPLVLAQNSRLADNEYSLEWDRYGGERTFRVAPIVGKGVKPAEVGFALGKTLELMAKEGKYAALDVDSKSVQAYRALRTELLRRGIPFGWSYDERTTIGFCPNGVGPPPPL